MTSPITVGGIAIFLLVVATMPLAWQSWEQYRSERRKFAVDFAFARQETETARKEREAAQMKAKLAQNETDAANAQAKHARFEVDALNLAHAFRAEASVASDLMDRVNLMRLRPETWPMEQTRLDETVDQARRLLSKYRVLDQPAAWDAGRRSSRHFPLPNALSFTKTWPPYSTRSRRRSSCGRIDSWRIGVRRNRFVRPWRTPSLASAP